MKSHVFRVHAATNMLTGPSGSVTLRHHQAGRFLAALVLAVPRAEGLSRAAFLADWHTAPGTLGPDRTAISRVVKAVQNGLSQAGSASRVVSAPRKTTVGPWRMYAPATEDWRVDSDALSVLGSRSNPLQPNLCIAAQSTPEDMLPAMTAVVIADALAQQALYTEAVQHINEHEPGLRLSSEGRALLLLRTVRWLRRLGRRADAEGALVAARAHARAAHPQARANLLAECAVQTARITYDKAPLRLASRINFNTLSDQIELAGSAQLSWECANLRALASRRKLQALLARAPQARSADVATIADDALRSFRAAFFWLLVNFDAYHLQAVLVNYAYHLQWLMHETTPLLQAPNIADVVGAWHLSQTIVEKFDLPEDSAPRDRWLREDEAKRLFAATTGRLNLFLHLALYTAARKQALYELTWDRVDFETNVIVLDVPGRRTTKKRRATVPISTELREVLLAAHEKRTTDLVLTNKAEVWASVQSAVRRAGLSPAVKATSGQKPSATGISPHTLRHTAATWMARRGVPLWIVAKILGNSLVTIEKVYAKHAPEDLRAAINMIGGEK